MDRAKTLEVLRGMKFMQRKEEAKRREQFEIQQKERLEGRLPHPGDGRDKQQNAGPTILYVHNFPTSSYALSRRSFKAPQSEEAAKAASAAALAESDANVDGTTVHTHVPIDAIPEADGAESFEEDDGDELDPSAPGYTHKADAETSKDSEERPAKRFYVEGGIRAPKLPKKLEQEMARRKRQRDEEQEEDEDMPW